MSGAKRKGKFRKGVEDDYLNSLPLPESEDCIAQVLGARGSNIFEVALNAKEVTEKSSEHLALLPSKYRNVIWVKTKDYLILDGGAMDRGGEVSEGEGRGVHGDGEVSKQSGAENTGSKVQYAIKHILNRNQIKHIKKSGMWPDYFGPGESDVMGSGEGKVRTSYADDYAGIGEGIDGEGPDEGVDEG